MSNKHSSILPDSKRGDNIFDKYFTFIEKQKISGIDNHSLSKLNTSITIIERNLIDLSQNKKAFKELIERMDDAIQVVLDEWYRPLYMFSKNDVFVLSLAYNLFGLSLLINETNWTDEESLKSLLSFFAPSKDYIKLFSDNVTMHQDRYKSHAYQINYHTAKLSATDIVIDPRINATHVGPLEDLTDLTEHLNFKLYHRLNTEIFLIRTLDFYEENIEKLRATTRNLNVWEIIHNYQLSMFDTAQVQWSIKIKTDENHPDATNFLELLHHFSLALKLIDDQIEVNLEDWGNGSKWALLKVTIKSFFSREDVKSILTKAFDSADAQLVRKPIAEADKTEAEAERIMKETANLKTQQQAFESEELDLQMKRINVVKGALEAEEQMINNKLKAIQAANQLSEMIKSGLVKNDSSLEIEINGLIAYESGKLIQTKMDEIANRESIQPKLSTPDSSPEQGT